MIIDIIRSNFKIIIFGFVFTFFSSVGQSFFIGLFNSNIWNNIRLHIFKRINYSKGFNICCCCNYWNLSC